MKRESARIAGTRRDIWWDLSSSAQCQEHDSGSLSLPWCPVELDTFPPFPSRASGHMKIMQSVNARLNCQQHQSNNINPTSVVLSLLGKLTELNQDVSQGRMWVPNPVKKLIFWYLFFLGGCFETVANYENFACCCAPTDTYLWDNPIDS